MIRDAVAVVVKSVKIAESQKFSYVPIKKQVPVGLDFKMSTEQ